MGLEWDWNGDLRYGDGIMNCGVGGRERLGGTGREIDFITCC
jgi:hypothetical protein